MNNNRYLTMEMDMRPGGKATHYSKRLKSAAIWLVLLTIAAVGLFGYSETESGPLRSRVYKLRHIDSSLAKELLVRLKIGADFNTLADDVLIVTSGRTLDLIKASSVMNVADRQTPVEIRRLMAPSADDPAPSPEELSVRLRSLTLGTLTDGPPTGVPNPTIVDMFEGTLLGIGTAEALDMVESAIEAWKTNRRPRTEPPVETPVPVVETAAVQQPSLAEIAAQIFGSRNDLTAVEPNAVEADAAEEHREPVLIETTEQREETDPEADIDDIERALLEFQEEAEAAEAADDPEAADRQLRAALEQLLRSAQDEPDLQAGPAETAADDETAASVEPALPTEEKPDEEQSPPVVDTRIVTRPALSEEQTQTELELTITLPEEVEIEALLELVGKQLGLNYMYDRAIFQGAPGKIMLKIHDGKIRVGDLYSLLESVLRFRGFIMTRRDSLVTIVRQQEIANVDPVLRHPDEDILPGDVMVSSVFQLKYVNTQTAQNLLSQMRLGTGFNAIAESGTLIITDYAFRMERIREVLAMIDVEGEPKDFQFRQLKYMEAGELVPKVKALSSQIQGVTVTVAGQATATPAQQIDPRTGRPVPLTAAQRAQQAAAQRAAAQQQQAAQASALPQEGVYLEADERTNRVLMIGYANEIDIIDQLIDSLDVPSYNLRFVREYVIQYVEATDVVTVLNDLGLARVTVSGTRQQQAARPAARPGQQLTPQQLAQQQAAQAQQQPSMAAGGPGDPYISLRGATNSLLVNATDEQHKAIELVISHVDVIQKDQRTIREYEIQYVDTQTVLDTLGELGIITPRTTTAGGGARAAAGQQPQQAARAQQQGMSPEGAAFTALPTADGTEREITAQEPQIAVLPATNSLLIHATPRQHGAIAMVIAHADRQRDRMFAPYVVYALENQDPIELAGILNQLIKETIEEAGAGTPSAPDARIQTRPGQMAVLPSGEEQRIRIVPDEKTYSLIVYANQRNQQWVGDLIRELDEYRPQVLLDVTLVEITKDDAFQYDLDIIAKTYGGATLQSGNIIGSQMGFSQSNFLDARSASGTGTAFFNSENIQALLKVVENKGYGRIMAKPKLLVNDNQEGEINAETTTAVPQERTNVQLPATGGTPVTTTDVTFTDYTAGVNLKIRPHISKGNMLRLEIKLNRVDFTLRDPVSLPSGSVPVPPDRLSSDVTTTATVPDGTTIILGGLEKVDQIKRTTKVPILGDLPLVGGLFRGVNNADKQNHLYVFVKANILRPGDQIEGMEDMRRVSERNRRAFEASEENFQKMESWPGIKNRPLDPIRALEEDH